MVLMKGFQMRFRVPRWSIIGLLANTERLQLSSYATRDNHQSTTFFAVSFSLVVCVHTYISDDSGVIIAAWLTVIVRDIFISELLI